MPGTQKFGTGISAEFAPGGGGTDPLAWHNTLDAFGAVKQIGTSDNFALPFYTNNVERFRLLSDQLAICAGRTTQIRANQDFFSWQIDRNDIVAFDGLNATTGTAALCEYVARVDAGGGLAAVGMGICSSAYTVSNFFGPHKGYFQVTNGDAVLVADTPGKRVEVWAGLQLISLFEYDSAGATHYKFSLGAAQFDSSGGRLYATGAPLSLEVDGTSAFVVAKADETAILTVDTTNTHVSVGTAVDSYITLGVNSPSAGARNVGCKNVTDGASASAGFYAEGDGGHYVELFRTASTFTPIVGWEAASGILDSDQQIILVTQGAKGMKFKTNGNNVRFEIGAAGEMGFFGTAAIAKPTGVAVTAAGIHAALVSLGLIAA